jgi:site-specific recombinase XerD
MNMKQLKEMLGHSSLQMVETYAKLAELDLQKAQQLSDVADRWGL